MNSYSIFCYAAAVGMVIYLAYRIKTIWGIRQRDNRIFSLFWVWPGLWFLVLNLIPFWQTPPTPVSAVLIAMVLATFTDFIYFYGLKSAGGNHQLISGLLLIPCLLFAFRNQLDPRDKEMLVLPHHGEALVWTDSAVNPRAWYFIDPKIRLDSEQGPQHARANYARAIFAPLTGVIHAYDSDRGVISIKAASGAVVHLGPMLAGSAQLQLGQKVAANMPLGLSDLSEGTPGIRLEVEGDTPVVFRELVYGRFRATQNDTALPRRNDMVMSQAMGRFKVK